MKGGFIMNMNPVVRSSNPTQRVFSKTAVLTLSVSLIVTALTVLARGICAMIFNQKLTVCRSLYHVFGDGSVGMINLIVGIVTAALIFMLGTGLLFARSGARSDPTSAMGLSFLKYVLYRIECCVASLHTQGYGSHGRRGVEDRQGERSRQYAAILYKHPVNLQLPCRLAARRDKYQTAFRSCIKNLVDNLYGHPGKLAQAAL